MGGGCGNDKQWGGAGNDTIYAARGRDETLGEDGDDTLWAMARADVHGPNDAHGDILHGGPGTTRSARATVSRTRSTAGRASTRCTWTSRT